MQLTFFINPEMIKDATSEFVPKGRVPAILSVASAWGHKPPRTCSALMASIEWGTQSPAGLGGPGSPGSAPWPGVSRHPGVSTATGPRGLSGRLPAGIRRQLGSCRVLGPQCGLRAAPQAAVTTEGAWQAPWEQGAGPGPPSLPGAGGGGPQRRGSHLGGFPGRGRKPGPRPEDTAGVWGRGRRDGDPGKSVPGERGSPADGPGASWRTARHPSP